MGCMHKHYGMEFINIMGWNEYYGITGVEGELCDEGGQLSSVACV